MLNSKVFLSWRQVLHSGVPITLIPLDATRTIPVDENFLSAFEQKQDSYEARYSFQSLKMVRDAWLSGDFYKVNLIASSFHNRNGIISTKLTYYMYMSGKCTFMDI